MQSHKLSPFWTAEPGAMHGCVTSCFNKSRMGLDMSRMYTHLTNLHLCHFYSCFSSFFSLSFFEFDYSYFLCLLFVFLLLLQLIMIHSCQIFLFLSFLHYLLLLLFFCCSSYLDLAIHHMFFYLFKKRSIRGWEEKPLQPWGKRVAKPAS